MCFPAREILVIGSKIKLAFTSAPANTFTGCVCGRAGEGGGRETVIFCTPTGTLLMVKFPLMSVTAVSKRETVYRNSGSLPVHAYVSFTLLLTVPVAISLSSSILRVVISPATTTTLGMVLEHNPVCLLQGYKRQGFVCLRNNRHWCRQYHAADFHH